MDKVEITLSANKNKDSKREELLKIAYQMFLEKGYFKTGVREIARAANVTPGLITYHFKTKREMAVEIVKGKMKQFTDITRQYVDWDKEPILYSAVLERLTYSVFSSPRFYDFYRDILKEDIMFEVLADSGMETDMKIWKIYCPDLDKGTAIRLATYGNYVSACMERALVLYGNDKLAFHESVPESVFKVSISMWHFDNEKEIIRQCCTRSLEIVDNILLRHRELYE